MIVGSSLFTFSLTTSCSSSSHKTSNSHNHTPFEFWNQALQSTRQLRKIGGKKQQGAITCQQQILLMQEKAFLEAASTALFPMSPSIASDKLQPDYKEEFYGTVLNSVTGAYEAERKGQEFIGTGPNLKYHASDAGIQVFGVDPITKMENMRAQESAVAAGLPLSNFESIQAVCMFLP
ncbi:hypothetical protein H0E87_019409 [Populus deltoides]|uniref:Uncharacterized protein n=1 Tax=Populus deltoides TaxID=3696 RepID=A0A8T2XUY4_POPDE|nr:hypothetical protein H0E87_019409 [Populus deltoides]